MSCRSWTWRDRQLNHPNSNKRAMLSSDPKVVWVSRLITRYCDPGMCWKNINNIFLSSDSNTYNNLMSSRMNLESMSPGVKPWHQSKKTFSVTVQWHYNFHFTNLYASSWHFVQTLNGNTLQYAHASIISAAANITLLLTQNMLLNVMFICLIGLANAGKKCVK